MHDEPLIRLADWLANVTTLGPGRRFVLWVQGCCFDCPGCTSPEWRPIQGGRLVSVTELVQTITDACPPSSQISGVTFSGGEPMLQATGLLEVWRRLKAAYPEWTLIVFSGFTMEEILGSPYRERAQLVLKSDILIDGRYVERLNNGKGLRGSSNQRILIRTDTYKGMENHLETREREMELRFRTSGLMLAGIPPLGFHDVVDESLTNFCANDPVDESV